MGPDERYAEWLKKMGLVNSNMVRRAHFDKYEALHTSLAASEAKRAELEGLLREVSTAGVDGTRAYSSHEERFDVDGNGTAYPSDHGIWVLWIDHNAIVNKLDGLLRRVVSAANAYAIACGHGRADMAPLDKRLRDDITTALRGEEAPDA